MIEQIRGYSRESVRQKLAEMFEGVEAFLGKGDAFDYENYRLFDGGGINGSREAVVLVPLTEDSPSRIIDRQLGKEVLLKDVSPLPWAGVVVLSPNECFSGLTENEPALIRLVDDADDRLGSWAYAEYIDEYGTAVKITDEVEKLIGVQEPESMKYKANVLWHAVTCTSVGTNQK